MLSATLEIDGKKADIGTGLSDSVQSFLGQPGVANQQNHAASSASNSILLDVISASPGSTGSIPFTIDIPLTFSFDARVIGGGEAFFSVGAISTSLSLGPTQLIYRTSLKRGNRPAALETGRKAARPHRAWVIYAITKLDTRTAARR